MAPHAGSLTHLALPCRNLDTSTAWYEAHTPLRVVHHRVDPEGQVAWIAEPDRPGTPFAHLGVELDSREAVDEAAQRGRTAGCLAWDPAERPPPVGYICALADPDGNLVEFSFGQDVAAVVENPPE